MSAPTLSAEFGYLYEQEGIRLLRTCLRAGSADDLHQARLNFSEAFKVWVTFAKTSKGNLERPGRSAGDEITQFRNGLDLDVVRTDLLLVLRLCATGLLANMVLEMRTEVEKFTSVRAKGRGDHLIRIFVELNSPMPRASLIALWLDEAKSAREKPRSQDPKIAATLDGIDVLVQLLADVSRPILDPNLIWDKPPHHLTDAQKRADTHFARSSSPEFLCHLSQLMILSLHEMIHGFRAPAAASRKEFSVPARNRASFSRTERT